MEKKYFNLPYDLSGSMAKNRFRNEILWGLEKIYELYKADKDFVIVFDYVCDIETHIDGKIECYQVKTANAAASYTVNKIVKPDKTGKSILGKLYSIKCADEDEGIVNKLALVVNVPLRTLDDKIHSTDAEVAFVDLDKNTIQKVEEYLSAECGVVNVDLKDCYYIYTSMDLFNPQESLLGKTINFFMDVYGEEPKRASVLFTTLVHTIEIKACHEMKSKTYRELVEKKGFTRFEFEKIIKKAIDISDNSVQMIRQEVDSIYPEFSLRTKMNMSVVTMMKELRVNKFLKKIEEKIVRFILENLEKFDGDMVDAIQTLELLFKDDFSVENNLWDRHAIYIIVLVKVREGYYA